MCGVSYSERACQQLQVIYATVVVSRNLKNVTIERNAVSSLLLGLCDAVVEVDETLGAKS